MTVHHQRQGKGYIKPGTEPVTDRSREAFAIIESHDWTRERVQPSSTHRRDRQDGLPSSGSIDNVHAPGDRSDKVRTDLSEKRVQDEKKNRASCRPASETVQDPSGVE